MATEASLQIDENTGASTIGDTGGQLHIDENTGASAIGDTGGMLQTDEYVVGVHLRWGLSSMNPNT